MKEQAMQPDFPFGKGGAFSSSVASYGVDDVDVSEVISRIVADRKTIYRFIATFVLVAIAFLLYVTPLYEAESILRIEPKEQVMDTANHSETEMEIIRSRSLIEAVIREQGIGFEIIDVTESRGLLATFLPFLHQEKNPQHASGKKAFSFKINYLEVPARMINKPLRIIARGEGSFALYDEDGSLLITGDESKEWTSANGNIKIKVSDMNLPADTKITVVARDHESFIGLMSKALRVERKGSSGKSELVRVSFRHQNKIFAANFIDTLLKKYLENAYDRKTRGLMRAVAFLEQEIEDNLSDMQKAEESLKKFREQENLVDLEAETKLTVDQLFALQKEIFNTKSRIREMAEFYTDKHPAQQVLIEKLAFLDNEMKDLEAKISYMPEQQRIYVQLARDAETTSRIYEYNAERMNQLNIEAHSSVGYARIVDEPHYSKKPVWPNAMLILFAGFISGLLLGLLYVSARVLKNLFFADSAKHLEKYLEMPVYASVIQSNKGSLIEDSESNAYKTLKNLAENIEFLLAGNSKTVFFTSDQNMQGSTFIATNFAAICSSLNKKVLLIDANIAKPEVHEYFTQVKSPGLSELIVNKAKPSDVVRSANGYDNLSILAAGSTPPNGNALLLTKEFEKIITNYLTSYDLIVVDYPALSNRKLLVNLHHAGIVILSLKYLRNMRLFKRFIVTYLKGHVSKTGVILNQING